MKTVCDLCHFYSYAAHVRELTSFVHEKNLSAVFYLVDRRLRCLKDFIFYIALWKI